MQLFTVLGDAESDSDDDSGTSHDCSAVLPKRSIMADKSASFGNKG